MREESGREGGGEGERIGEGEGGEKGWGGRREVHSEGTFLT